MRRTTALTAVITAIALTALAGCKEDGAAAPAPAAASTAATASATATAAATASATAPAVTATPTVAGAFDPEQALEGVNKRPYASTVTVVTELGGEPLMTMTIRGNMGPVFTGRADVRTLDGSVRMEMVMTADANYVRDLSGSGKPWMKGPRSPESAQGDYSEYAKLLLAQGPAARKGMETRGGVPVFHLAGHLDIEQIAEIDPRTYRSSKPKGVTGFDLDQWIDAQGRTVYFEQRMDVRGRPAANKATFSDFGPPETFAAPTTG